MKRRIPVNVRVWTAKPARRANWRTNWKTKLLTLTILSGAVGSIVGGGWLAVLLIVNPTSVSWLSQFLPLWNAQAAPPQTLEEIRAEVQQADQTTGKPIYFSSHFSSQVNITEQQPGFRDLLLPILRPSKHCGSAVANCTQISELRIYRPASRAFLTSKGMSYELIDRIAVTGPEELTAIAALTQNPAITQGSSRRLPLTDVHFISGQAPSGIWFHLSGEWKRGSRVLYGQVMQYDPDRARLYTLQNWSSPAGELPHWQQITGDATPELLVNQSIGLEPQFQVYQLKPPRSLAQPMSLEAVSLTAAAIHDRTYTNALLLARHGLWSPALQLLKAYKSNAEKSGNRWTAAAQTQLDVIALHAKVTQAQAGRDWASPTQQILAQIMDGRWSQGLTTLKSAHSSGYDIQNLIKTNADRFWQRVEAAMRVNPRQADLQAWGMLVLAVKQNPTQAVAWLQKQPPLATKPSASTTLALLEPLNPPATLAASPATSQPRTPHSALRTPHSAPPASLIGTVIPLTAIQADDWLTPASTNLNLTAQQVWYRVEVLGFQQGQSWQTAALVAAQPTQQLWNSLGLSDPQLQIVAWRGAIPAQTIAATVKAVQLKNGRLSLLAMGSALPEQLRSATLVAITPNTVSWVQPTATQTLAELGQSGQSTDSPLSQLWQALQTAHLIPVTDVTTSSPDLLQTIGNWSVQRMDLTDSPQPEAVLTLESTDANQPRTVIFSEQGNLLYSDLQQPAQTLVAIAAADGSPVLILTDAQGTYLQQWSHQSQRFE